jgi:hypothetical protein
METGSPVNPYHGDSVISGRKCNITLLRLAVVSFLHLDLFSPGFRIISATRVPRRRDMEI